MSITLALRDPKVEVTAVDWASVLEVAKENAAGQVSATTPIKEGTSSTRESKLLFSKASELVRHGAHHAACA
jgi:hypothetical protein